MGTAAKLKSQFYIYFDFYRVKQTISTKNICIDYIGMEFFKLSFVLLFVGILWNDFLQKQASNISTD